ncbi:hypothetical protein Tco_1511772, partial [Tanacetum coccineum]
DLDHAPFSLNLGLSFFQSFDLDSCPLDQLVQNNSLWCVSCQTRVSFFMGIDQWELLYDISLPARSVALELHIHMYQWLQNLKQGSKSVKDYTTEFYQLIARNEIQETEDQLRALAFEKLNHLVGSLSSPAVTGASGSGNVTSRFAPSQAKASGGNTGPVSRESSSSGLKCFNYGKPGRRKSECKKAGKIHLFADPEGDDDAAYEEYEEASVYDEEPECRRSMCLELWG